MFVWVDPMAPYVTVIKSGFNPARCANRSLSVLTPRSVRGGKSSNDIITLLELYVLKTITIRRWWNTLGLGAKDAMIVSSVARIGKVHLPVRASGLIVKPAVGDHSVVSHAISLLLFGPVGILQGRAYGNNTWRASN